MQTSNVHSPAATNVQIYTAVKSHTDVEKLGANDSTITNVVSVEILAINSKIPTLVEIPANNQSITAIQSFVSINDTNCIVQSPTSIPKHKSKICRQNSQLTTINICIFLGISIVQSEITAPCSIQNGDKIFPQYNPVLMKCTLKVQSRLPASTRLDCSVKECYSCNLKKLSNQLIQVHAITNKAKRKKLLRKAKKVSMNKV